jgi:phospholipid/cholesterol/gamma-HCH transport system permease protein
MSVLGSIGDATLQRWGRMRYTAAVTAGALRLAVQPASWTGPVRVLMAKQILFTGVDAVSLILFIGVLVGLTVVTQAQLWLVRFGQSDMLGPLLVAVLIRGAGPVLVNFIVIGRSGTAVVTELATMRVHGQIRLLDAQGLDPMIYLVMPRVLGVAVSTLCLTVLFVVGALGTGYLVGQLLGVGAGDPGLFLESVLRPIRMVDVFDFLAKSIVPGLLAGTICCVEGLSISGSATEVPQAATRAVVRSIAALLVVSAVVSVLAL